MKKLDLILNDIYEKNFIVLIIKIIAFFVNYYLYNEVSSNKKAKKDIFCFFI